MDSTADLPPLNAWLPTPSGLSRLVTVPEQVEVTALPEGGAALMLLRNGVEVQRFVLPSRAALHVAALLVSVADPVHAPVHAPDHAPAGAAPSRESLSRRPA